MKKETYLYIHIPFCKHRCDYCSFYSVDNLKNKTSYIKALKKDLENLSQNYQVRLKTLYFGGGSPAVLTISELGDILDTIYQNFDCRIEEFTFEINPHQVTKSYIKQIIKLGVNRISLGVQSFNQSYLNAIGRKASASKSKDAYYMIRECGIKNISLDLIYGGPNSTVESVKKDLDEFIVLDPEHISCYCLSVDSNCKLDKRLQKGFIRLPDEDNIAEQMEFINSYLRQNKFDRYEISNYAKQTYQSKHNMAYWQYKDCLGAGAAAVYTYKNIRVENYPDIEKYISSVKNEEFPLGECYKLSNNDKFLEFLIMGFRLKSGLSLSESKSRFGIDILKDLDSWIKKYQKLGLIVVQEDKVYFTDHALNISNTILSELF